MWNQPEPQQQLQKTVDNTYDPNHSCRTCGKLESSDSPLHECGTCGSVVYCSMKCLQNDWKTHETDCNRIGAKHLLQALLLNECPDSNGLDDTCDDTIQRLTRHKRVINAQITYNVAPPDDEDDDNIIDERSTPQRTLQGWTTPLHECVKYQNLDAIQLLLDHGAKVNLLNDQHQTPLLLAVQSLTSTTAPTAKSTSSSPSRSTDMDETVALQIVELLLQSGADPNIAAHNGSTALAVAQTNQNIVIQLLQEAESTKNDT